jgi:DNA-directed RNA polymerase subunit F
MNPTIVSEQPLSIYDVKKLLKETKKRDSELSLRAQKCDDYVGQFAKLPEKSYKELKESLIALEIPRLKEEHICKLIDINPLGVEDVKLILSSYTVTVKNDDVKRIDAVFAEYRK